MNVDAARNQGGGSATRDGGGGRNHNPLPDVRRFLMSYKVPYTNVVNGTGPADVARAFGVTDIPANFLIGKDGKIVRVEAFGADLDRAIAEALGEKKAEAGDTCPKAGPLIGSSDRTPSESGMARARRCGQERPPPGPFVRANRGIGRMTLSSGGRPPEQRFEGATGVPPFAGRARGKRSAFACAPAPYRGRAAMLANAIQAGISYSPAGLPSRRHQYGGPSFEGA